MEPKSKNLERNFLKYTKFLKGTVAGPDADGPAEPVPAGAGEAFYRARVLDMTQTDQCLQVQVRPSTGHGCWT